MKKIKNKEQPKFKISKEQVKDIYKEYTFNVDDDTLEYDDEMLALLKAFNKLDIADKIILELYAETKSQRKTSEILGVSRTTLIKVLNNIRDKIKQNI